MHCVEIQTVHANGDETWQRWRCRDEDDAARQAMAVLVGAFCDVSGDEAQHDADLPVPLDMPDWHVNDHGEPVCVRVREYGAAAQARLGIFTVSA